MSKQCTKPKRKRDDSWFKEKVLVVEAQAHGQNLNEEELAFLVDPGILEDTSLSAKVAKLSSGTWTRGCSKLMTSRSLLANHLHNQQLMGTCQIQEIMSISKDYGFVISNLEVAFRQHTCYIRNLEGVDLLTGSRGDNLYTLSLGDMMASSPICLLSKASKTKSWLWHRRLSHLNFGAINHLARHGLVRGLPKLKFEKDHLCSACALGKSTKKPHKPKSEDNTNQEKLYLLHMDLCDQCVSRVSIGNKYLWLFLTNVLTLDIPMVFKCLAIKR
ncbi:retrovirus-related pol polyprotein from transposon TNT 1-94 [Tanacetum coccineum]